MASSFGLGMQTTFLFVRQTVVETCQSSKQFYPGHIGHLYTAYLLSITTTGVIRTTARREEAEKESGVCRGN